MKLCRKFMKSTKHYQHKTAQRLLIIMQKLHLKAMIYLNLNSYYSLREDKFIKIIKIKCVLSICAARYLWELFFDRQIIQIRFINRRYNAIQRCRNFHGNRLMSLWESLKGSMSIFLFSLHNSIIIININIKSGCDLFVIEPDSVEIWIIIHENFT